MMRIGLTGGIGVGKSTIARIFEVLGIPVYYADEAAKKLMAENEELKQQIIAAFGAGSYTDGRLNRGHLSSVVFNNPQQLAALNAIVHPATLKDAKEWMGRQHAPYILKEAALIFESGSQKDLDKVIGVYAPEELRLKRIMQRDVITEEGVRLRMQHQMNDEEKMKLCDFIIINDEKHLLLDQVLEIDKRIRSLDM